MRCKRYEDYRELLKDAGIANSFIKYAELELGIFLGDYGSALVKDKDIEPSKDDTFSMNILGEITTVGVTCLPIVPGYEYKYYYWLID